jgi:hypothetical protein
MTETENKKGKLERFASSYGPLMGFVLTAAGLIISVYNFSADQKSKSALEFKRDFWTKQSEIYLKTSQAIGSICAEINKPDDDFDNTRYIKAKADFESLYWGEMNFVKDTQVIAEMKSFDEYIRDFNPKVQDPDYRSQVINLGDKIIATCRESYIKSFDNLQVETPVYEAPMTATQKDTPVHKEDTGKKK